MRDLVISTFNEKKGKEMQTILARLLSDTCLRTLSEFPEAKEPEETGTTYEDNATIKAISAVAATKLFCIADDAGLEVDFLDGAPGVYSKRFGGEDLPFDQKIAKILDLMRDVPVERRTARFRCFVVLADPNLRTQSFHAECEGRIGENPGGSGGFGYDPIFYLPQLGRTMADLSPDEKHLVSHRGKVLRAFAKYWNSDRN